MLKFQFECKSFSGKSVISNFRFEFTGCPISRFRIESFVDGKKDQSNIMKLFTIIILFIQVLSLSATVLELNQTNFDENIQRSENWFLTFYAQWCEHCKKLYPILDELSNYLETKQQIDKDYPKISIGKINAPKNRDLSERFAIDKYPRIIYKKGNLTGIYDGPRNLLGFQLFLDRFNDPIYQDITVHEDEFKIPSIHPYHNVTFVLQLYCNLKDDDSNTALPPCSPSTKAVFSAFKVVAAEVHLHTTLAVVHHTAIPETTSTTNKKVPTKPEVTLCKFSSQRIPFGKDVFDSSEHRLLTNEDELYCLQTLPTATDGKTSTTDIIKTFIERNNYPLINIFENHNFKILSHLNKTMIIAIIDETKEITTKTILTQLKSYYNQIIHDYPDRADHFYENYIIGYLDGKKWKQFVRHHDAYLPSILIIDHQDERHAVMRLPSSAKATEKFNTLIKKVLISLMVDESIEMNDTIAPGIVRKMIHRFKRYFPYSILIIALPTILLFLSLKFFPFPDRKKPKQH